MKRILFLLIATAGLCAAAQNQTTTAVIEGRILRTGTAAEPVPNALVTLTAVGPSGLSAEAAVQLTAQIESIRRNNAIQGTAREDTQAAVASFLDRNGTAPNAPVFVLTDSAGRFTFRDVPPGRYSVRGEREGFSAPRINETYQTGFVKSVLVERDKKVAPVEMDLLPSGVLSGRVFDPQGQPVANVSVMAYRVIIATQRNGDELWTNGRSVMTNDRGEFRLLNVLPGGLWLSATPRPAGLQSSLERTFFGDVTLPETATRIKVNTGGEVGNLDIRLQPRAAAYKITGTATNPFAIPNPTTGVVDRSISTFVLVNRKVSLIDEGRLNVQNALPVNARPNGEFEIRDVRAGSYDLVATLADRATGQTLSAKAPVEVRNGDVTGISLVMSGGVRFKGQVEVRGAQASTIKPESLSINLQSIGPIAGTTPMKPDATGQFSRERVPEERYRAQVNGLPSSAYIEDIRYGGSSVFDEGFTVDSTPSVLDVMVNSGGQTLAGTVRATTGDPVAAATVVLVPPVAQRKNPVRFKQATTDEAGRFTLRGIAPGQYTIYAWENVYSTAWLNARYLAHFETRGRPISITATPPAEMRLDVIPTENYLESWAR